ncbi:MAG: hypothetical protein ABSD28_15780 [Tepidisphaeraceae bacterium]|jgi:hypothetical protein
MAATKKYYREGARRIIDLTSRCNPSKSSPAAQIFTSDYLPPASLEIAEDAEQCTIATDEDRWTLMKRKGFCLDLSVSI